MCVSISRRRPLSQLLVLAAMVTLALVATPSAFGDGAVLLRGDGGTAWLTLSNDSWVVHMQFEANPGDLVLIDPDGEPWIHWEAVNVPLYVTNAKNQNKVLFSGVGDFNFSASIIIDDFETGMWHTDNVWMIIRVTGEVIDKDGVTYDLDARGFFRDGVGDVTITITPQ
jgi:hypothetical protein